MPRIARVVPPGVPHHVTQRGNRRMQTFFSDEDYQLYIDLAAQWMEARGVEVWAYCLMPNHPVAGQKSMTENTLKSKDKIEVKYEYTKKMVCFPRFTMAR